MANNNEVRYSGTKLIKLNKKGILKPNEDGYYKLPLGALSAYNSCGDFYTAKESVRALFDKSSVLQRRVKSHCLKSELGHPKPFGLKKSEYIQRLYNIEETRVCAHIVEFWLDENSVKDDNGRPVLAIMGLVKPAGPFGYVLKEDIENRLQDVCFSIRSFTSDYFVGATKFKDIEEVLTFDYVTEPGISTARKYHAPGLESCAAVFNNDEMQLSREDFIEAKCKMVEMANSGISVESEISSMENLFLKKNWTNNVSGKKPIYYGLKDK